MRPWEGSVTRRGRGSVRYRSRDDRDPVGLYQEHHITERHGVTAEQFEGAWTDRVDVVVRQDGSYESLGVTDDGREV